MDENNPKVRLAKRGIDMMLDKAVAQEKAGNREEAEAYLEKALRYERISRGEEAGPK